MEKKIPEEILDNIFGYRVDEISEEEKTKIKENENENDQSEDIYEGILEEHEMKILDNVLNIKDEHIKVPVEETIIHGEKVRKIHIQDKKIRVPISEPTVEENNSQQYWEKYSTTPKVYTCKANIPTHPELKEIFVPHGLIGAILYAYNYHADIVLSPDDFWITIMHVVSKYIIDHAEELRGKFVSHTGKQAIVVGSSAKIEDANWNSVLDQFNAALKENVKGDFIAKNICDFSTTKEVEHYVSISSLMCSMQKYFQYILYGCGIRNVYFMGTLADWVKLKEKVKGIIEYIDDEEWIESVEKILDHFIETFNGSVNVDFWNKMVDKIHGINPSTGGIDTMLDNFTGWILKLMRAGNYKVNKYAFPKIVFKVPITYIEGNGTKTELTLLSGFSGLRYKQEAYRPQLSYAVIKGEPKEQEPEY